MGMNLDIWAVAILLSSAWSRSSPVSASLRSWRKERDFLLLSVGICWRVIQYCVKAERMAMAKIMKELTEPKPARTERSTIPKSCGLKS